MSSIPRAPAAQPAPRVNSTAAARPAAFSPLLAILRKELTENLKWVVASLALQSIVVGIYLWNAFSTKDYGATRISMLNIDNALFDSGLQNIAMTFAIGTAIFTAAFQIFTERTFDLRAFFRHRAISPSHLFLGKALAGLLIYSLCIGLPILLFILWSATSPSAGILFDISFAQPYLVYFLCGLAYYFAALVVAVREARWYLSRTLPFAAALLASVCTFNCHSFHLALFAVLAIDALLALAAWNAYVHAGIDQPLGQPPLAAPKLSHPIAPLTLLRKFALPVVILAALTLISCFLIFLNAEISSLASQTNFFAASYGEYHFSYYELQPDASPMVMTSTSRRLPGDAAWTYERHYTDLKGNPLPAPATQPSPGSSEGYLGGLPQGRGPYYVDPSSKIAVLADGVLRQPTPSPSLPRGRWYYEIPWRLFVGYDLPDGKLIATIGASGYSTGFAEPFPASAIMEDGYLLVGNRALLFGVKTTPAGPQYDANVVFEAPSGETIRQIGSFTESFGSPEHITIATATDNNMYLSIAPRPYQSSATNQPYIAPLPIEHPLDTFDARISYRPEFDRIAVRYYFREAASRVVLKYISTFTAHGQPIASFSLPPLLPDTARNERRPAEKTALFTIGLIDAFRNPWISSCFQIDIHNDVQNLFDTNSTLPLTVYPFAGNSSISAFYYSGLFLPILLASACTLWLTTRYRFTLTGKILWTLATLFFGPLALLTLLFTQPLPARIPCPTCKHKRPATLPLCPHCHAPFPAPTPTGNEIFAPS